MSNWKCTHLVKLGHARIYCLPTFWSKKIHSKNWFKIKRPIYILGAFWSTMKKVKLKSKIKFSKSYFAGSFSPYFFLWKNKNPRDMPMFSDKVQIAQFQKYPVSGVQTEAIKKNKRVFLTNYAIQGSCLQVCFYDWL